MYAGLDIPPIGCVGVGYAGVGTGNADFGLGGIGEGVVGVERKGTAEE